MDGKTFDFERECERVANGQVVVLTAMTTGSETGNFPCLFMVFACLSLSMGAARGQHHRLRSSAQISARMRGNAPAGWLWRPSSTPPLRGRLASYPVSAAGPMVSCNQGHAHEIGQARSLHLGHEVGPVDLDRSWADPEIIRNLLVGMSGHETLEDIALAVRKSGEAALDLAAFGFALVIPMQRVERFIATEIESTDVDDFE